ncbi:MAG: hypothetical protein HUU10_11865 [Bacteroidetes bacterium]|nr:hypothetical protein [Bacteroidota bacterium]
MNDVKTEQRFPGPGVWLTVLLAAGGLAVWLLSAETGAIKAALNQQAQERLLQIRTKTETPVVVFLGSSILKHAVPFDNSFETAFTQRTGKVVKSVRFIRYQGSALDYLPVLDMIIQHPPDLLVIDQSLLLTNRPTPAESPLEIFRGKIRSLAGAEDNFLKFALRANSPEDETEFLTNKRNKRQLKREVKPEELESKADGLSQGFLSDHPLLSPDLIQRLLDLSAMGTRIRILVLPRIAQFEKNPILVGLKTQFTSEFSRAFSDSQAVAIWPSIPVPENRLFRDPGHLNIQGRRQLLPAIIQLVNQEVYADSVR